MLVPDDVGLEELKAYFREAAADPELVGPQKLTGIKFPLSIACAPERFAEWLSRRRYAPTTFANPEEREQRLADELAKQRALSPIGARRRPSASKPFDAPASDAASGASKDPIATLVAGVGSEIPVSRNAKRASRA